jgi:hypothetical protein
VTDKIQNQHNPVGIDYTAQLQGVLRLSYEGLWFHEGKQFENQALADLFSRSIVWDASEQAYFVQIGRQRARFTYDDTAYMVRELLVEIDTTTLRLSDGSQEPLRPATLKVGPEAQFYCLVKGGHRARFTRSAHQDLLQYAIDDDTVELNGVRISLKTTQDS